MSLFRGVPAVIYGYILSSMVYFYSYAKMKEFMKKRYQENQDKEHLAYE